MSKVNERNHKYNAETMVLSGQLVLPVSQKIEPQAHTKLPENGGYFSQRLDGYRLESVVTFRSGYSHTAGCLSDKPGGGHTTLTTTVVEGLNVLEVLTADRVVGQTITEHPLEGYMPSISFLGTRFENLRIAGKEVDVDLDLDFLGPKPAKDASYLNDSGFRARVDKQYARIRGQNLPPAILGRYNQLPPESKPEASLECSLISKAEPSRFGRPCGHVIEIPGFGRILLAVLRVEHWDPNKKTGIPMRTKISLTMLEIEMGCIGNGSAAAGNTIVNGRGAGG